MRDRKDGKLVKGDAENPVETTEVWTFVRENGGDWQLSAIQET
jgi:predicted lipid-binding transport protein (Tim44 family)